ncbi:progonadoliberin-2 [Eumetopias jubatus]|uniref:progonadoliberin-2 n=1 Tax=Eumetopias jubatus TaxID=34886 RepID=UPI0010162C3D|nr:progonadoliberin-2 [Eumetopias jubatus]
MLHCPLSWVPAHGPPGRREKPPGELAVWGSYCRLEEPPQGATSSTAFPWLGFLLLLTVHPGSSKAQHWSHGWYPGGKQASSSAQHPQHAPRLLASSPDQTALDFPSNPLAPPKNSVGRAEPQAGGLRRKQHLVQTLLTGRRAPRPVALQ